MSLPDGAENWQPAPSRKRWHALPNHTPRPKVAQGQSPHDVPATTACGHLLTMGLVARKRKNVNCPDCLQRIA
jgi:hypothetical protein